MTKSLAKYEPKQLFNSDKVHQKFNEVLGKKSKGFITSILQAISNSDKLANADANSVYNAAMTAAVLDLPINPNLGFAYIIPYNNKGGTVAQFQMGYKGYIQLCQRSGLFKTISATPIYEGQLEKENPLTGFEFNFDFQQSEKVIGYASYFSLTNGFEKTFYMSLEKVKAHAKEYSQSYKKGFGPWKDDFDSMAIKTVLKLLLSKFAPMSIDMQKAVTFDQAEVKDIDRMEVSYVDNKDETEQPTDRETIDIDDGNENTEELLAEVNDLGKKVHGGINKWVKASKEYVSQTGESVDGLHELSLEGLKSVKQQLEADLEEA